MMQALLVWLLVLKNLGLEVLKRSGCTHTYVHTELLIRVVWVQQAGRR
jgi:hypothetical protein